MTLKQCSTGTTISFPGKRRKYRVRDHAKPYLELRPGLSSDYADGRNYDEHPGTHLYTSSGAIIHVRSDREVIVVTR
jgi:hypothetical protein